MYMCCFGELCLVFTWFKNCSLHFSLTVVVGDITVNICFVVAELMLFPV